MKKGSLFIIVEKGGKKLPSFLSEGEIVEYTGEYSPSIFNSSIHYKVKRENKKEIWVYDYEIRPLQNSIKRLGG